MQCISLVILPASFLEVEMWFQVILLLPILVFNDKQVNSKLPPVTSLASANEGLVTHGWITGVMEYGCFISFYDNIKGLAHRYCLPAACHIVTR